MIATLFRELADGAPALAPLLGDADLERELAASLVDFIYGAPSSVRSRAA